MSKPQTIYDEQLKVWHGPEPEPFYDSEVSLGNVIFMFLKRFPKNINQISDIDGSVVTNEEVLNWSIQIASYLKKQGYNHEDIVGVVAGSSKHLVSVVFGCFFNGTPFHAVNPVYDHATLQTIFNLTKPKVIFCDGMDYEKTRQATEEYKPQIFTLCDHIDGVPKITDLLQETGMEKFYVPERCAVGGDQTVAILCSSGTTGLPKAVCINKDMILTHFHYINSEDVVYSPSGMDWISGVIFLIWSTIGGCRRIITNKAYTPEHLVHLLTTYKITITNTSPHHIALILGCPSAAKQENFDSIKFMSCGGAPVSYSTLKQMQNLLKNGIVAFVYGLTEVGSVTLHIGLASPTGNCVGNLTPGMHVRIVDDNGKNLGPNEVGNIFIKRGRWPGYYANVKATKLFQDEDGWLHSGDIGYFDNENLLFVVDRIKDILKYRSNQYWPGEIEDVILQLPDVVDVCVTGVYNESDGDCAGAVVVKKHNSNLTVKDIEDHVKQHLIVDFKQLHGGVVFVDHLPQNINGKKNKAETKVLLEKAKLAAC